jgi:hypothetical protein
VTYIVFLIAGHGGGSTVVLAVEHSIVNGHEEVSLGHGLREETPHLQMLHHFGFIREDNKDKINS